jgi:peptidyl-prolyl cis-trans isomerase C
MYQKLIFILFPLFFFLSACNSSGPQGKEIVAKIGDNYLTRDVVLSLTPNTLTGADREYFIKRIIEQWIDNQTLALKALQEDYELTTKENWQIQNLEADMLAAKYLNTKMKLNYHVTDQEIEDYYQANQDQFKRQFDEVHLIHLYFEQLDKTIASEIRKSKSLMDIIKKNYMDRQINRVIEPNGDLGFVPLAQIRDKFRKTIGRKKTGVIYGPIKSEDGYHYVQVLDRQPAQSIRSLELIRDEIITYLQVAKRHRAIKILKEEIRKEFNVETFYDNIL